MKRSSTPTHSLELPFIYEKYASQFVFTYSQNGNIILEKTEKDVGDSVEVENDILHIYLTQEETNLFCGGDVEMQMKVYTLNGKSIISDIIKIKVDDVLNDKVFV